MERLATAGNDAQIRIYNEEAQKKEVEISMKIKSNGKNLPGHSKRIFALKFDNE